MRAPATELASCPRFARASFVFTRDLMSLSSFHSFNPKMASNRIKPAENISADCADLQFSTKIKRDFLKYCFLKISELKNPSLKDEQLLSDRAVLK